MNRPIRQNPAEGSLQGTSRSVDDAAIEGLDARRRLVDDGVADFLDRHYDGPLREIVGYVALGGKRLRGILAILVCEALGGQRSDALPAAVAVELAHAASLVHDDVIDADVVRRGRPALHVRYGLPAAVLVPHLILPRAILSAEVYGTPAIRTILEGWARVTQGQVSDSIPRGALGGTEEREAEEMAVIEYLEIVRGKTAALFECAAELGALAAREGQHVSLARDYAGWLGSAFQIADDVTDLERHVDRPWATLLGDRGARSLDALRRVVAATAPERVTLEAIERARQYATRHLARCRERADSFPASPLHAFLGAFPAIAVEQIYREDRNSSPSRIHPAPDHPSGGA